MIEVIKYRGYEIAVMKIGFYVRDLGMYLKKIESAKKQIDAKVNSQQPKNYTHGN